MPSLIRSFFLAAGMTAILFGLCSTALDKVTLNRRTESAPAETLFPSEPTLGPRKVVLIPHYLPSALIGGGIVVCVYTFTLPKRLKE
jgi:hypothetical protein